jgi:hypothetical protein
MIEKIIDKVNTFKLLEDLGFDLELAKVYDLEKLKTTCMRAVGTAIDPDVLVNLPYLQKSLIENDDVISICDDLDKLNDILKFMSKYSDKLSNYSRDALRVLTAEEFKDFDNWTLYVFMRNFDVNTDNVAIILTNLQSYVRAATPDFTAPERAILSEIPYLSTTIVPTETFQHVSELLENNTVLKRFIIRANILELNVKINYDELNALAEETLNDVLCVVQNDNFAEFFQYWSKFGYNTQDTHKFMKNPVGFRDPCEYVKFARGIDVSAEWQITVILYAVSNNKHAFIRLIEENRELFDSLPNESLLFNAVFYDKYINLNDLNAKNLLSFQTMVNGKLRLDLLEDRVYTFNEISALYDTPSHYYKLYSLIEETNVDKRLANFMQIRKRRLLNDFSAEQVASLAVRLNEKPLSSWIKDEFSSVRGIRPYHAVKVLARCSEIGNLTDVYEIPILLRNGNLNVFDKEWDKLKTKLKLSNEFIEKHDSSIRAFLLKNGAEIINDYMNSVSYTEPLSVLIEAELAGQYLDVHYGDGCLDKELDAMVGDSWKENTALKDTITIKEYDDFLSVVQLGAVPADTCLRYARGTYVESLLSCFDASKKVVYVELEGNLCGRAIMRITKYRYESDVFSYVNKVSDTVKLAVVLEPLYTKWVADDLKKSISKLLYRLACEKARKLGADVLLHNNYLKLLEPNAKSDKVYMYVTASRAEKQYVETLGGTVGKALERTYRYTTVVKILDPSYI